MCDLMKKEPLYTNEPSARSEQQSRIVVKYAVYMRQEVVAQLNHLSTLVAIQISRQQSVKPFYQILNVWQRQQDFSFVLILACHCSTCILLAAVIIILAGSFGANTNNSIYLMLMTKAHRIWLRANSRL
jgi:uncharacterized iron-regulated protein